MGDQARRPMREELLAIPGIASAEFEGDPDAPAGVRVQLAPGADPEAVGREVSRVLAGHGMRSHLTAPSVAPQTPPPPPEPRTVVNLADFDHKAAPADEAPAQGAPQPVAPAPGSGGGDALPSEPEAEEIGGEEPVTGAVIAGEPVPQRAAESDEDVPPAEAQRPSGVPTLGEVTVTQGGVGVVVSVAIGDESAERPAVASEWGIDLALLEAVADLLGVSPVPRLLSVTTSEHDGVQVVAVLLDDGAARRAGSAVARGNRPWAVARALWSALSGPA